MSPNRLAVDQLTVGQMAANCYIVTERESGESVIIDPGDDGEYIISKIQEQSLRCVAIIATHGHFDHLMAACEVQLAFGVPFLIGQPDIFLVGQMNSSAKHFLKLQKMDPPPQITRTLSGDENISLGKLSLKVLHTPGHTPGGITLYSKEAGVAFVGDAIFAGGGVGRTDFSYSDKNLLAVSLKKILSLPPETILYSGHGEPSTVEEEKRIHGV